MHATLSSAWERLDRNVPMRCLSQCAFHERSCIFFLLLIQSPEAGGTPLVVGKPEVCGRQDQSLLLSLTSQCASM